MRTLRHSLRSISAVLAVAAAALVTASCVPADHSERDGAELRAPRYISLNPCVDAILANVADPYQVLAISHYSHDPASSSLDTDTASQFASTGDTVEELLARDPDVVLASSFVAPATRQAMQDLGIILRTFSSPTSIAESQAQIRYVGDLVYRAERAADLVVAIDRAVTGGRPAVGQRPISTVLWQPGEIVPGEGTLISELLREAGFASHSAALGMGQADYLPLETLLANPPELLLVAGNSRGQLHPALSELKGTRIETLDPALLYCGGPTIIKAMERLTEIREQMTRENAS